MSEQNHTPAPETSDAPQELDRSRPAGAPAGANDAQPSIAPEAPNSVEASTAPTNSAGVQAAAPAAAVEPAPAPSGGTASREAGSPNSASPDGAPVPDEPSADGSPNTTAPTPDHAPRRLPIRLPQILLDGTVRKNPLLVAGLGLAPALLLSDAAAALAIGVCTTLTLLVTSLLASLLGKHLPEKLRPALFTLVAAGLAVALELGVDALLPDLLPSTSLYLSLIAVGGLTLSRADYSTARSPLAALVDALACGVGYTLALTLIGIIKEAFGAGSIFGVDITFDIFPPMTALTTAAGGFILTGLLAGVMQGLRLYRARRRAARAKSKPENKEVSV